MRGNRTDISHSVIWTESASLGLTCPYSLVTGDNKTLWAVMRVDGGDGMPSHRTLPLLHATSTDSGHSWTEATPLPSDMRSSRPSATVLGNGALLVSAGRPGLDLFISRDGFGATWERHSIPTVHNGLVASEGRPKSWGFCKAFLPVAANYTFAGDPQPRIDTARDGGPLLGWSQTSGYTAVTTLEDNVGLVCFDKQGWGAGYYGAGLPPIFGEQGTWPKGRSLPEGCVLDVSYSFCMRVTVPPRHILTSSLANDSALAEVTRLQPNGQSTVVTLKSGGGVRSRGDGDGPSMVEANRTPAGAGAAAQTSVIKTDDSSDGPSWPSSTKTDDKTAPLWSAGSASSAIVRVPATSAMM